MRPNRVVLLPPPFCQYLHLLQRIKDLAVQQFIPQLSVEALVVAVVIGGLTFDIVTIDPAQRSANSGSEVVCEFPSP